MTLVSSCTLKPMGLNMMKKLRGHTIQQWSADFVAELEKSRSEKAAVAPLATQPPQALRWLKSAISGVRLI